MLAVLATLMIPVAAFIGLLLTVAGLYPLTAAVRGRRDDAKLILGLFLLAAVGTVLWMIASAEPGVR
jgi:hypothetical protein